MKSYLWLMVALFLLSCSKKMHVAHVEPTAYAVKSESDTTEINEEIIAMIAPYKEQMEAEMTSMIGLIGEQMPKQKPESALTHWLGDILQRQANEATKMDIDFSLMNWGGIRLPEIPQGPITVGKVYELMPFDNFIVLIEVNGVEVREIFNKIAASGGGWPVCDQVYVSMKEGQLVDLKIGGKDVLDERTYLMATSNFLGDGGDGLTMLPGNPRFEIDVLIRDAIIKDIREMTARDQAIFASKYGRMLNQ